MNFSYGSQTVTLVSVCVPFFGQKNKQSNFKVNVNTMRKTKKIQPAASQLDGRHIKFRKKKKKFYTKVRDKQLNYKYSDKIKWRF